MKQAMGDSQYISEVRKLLARLQSPDCQQARQQAAELIVATVRAGGLCHLFDSGHMLTHELVGRAGGLMLFNPVEIELKLAQNSPARRTPVAPAAKPASTCASASAAESAGQAAGVVTSFAATSPAAATFTATPAPTRARPPRVHLDEIAGMAEFVFSQAHWEAGDVLVIGSVSGVSRLVVEMARLAREAGIHVIALTSVRASQALPSAHPSGLRLYEVAEVVLDHGAPPQDAVLTWPGLETPICPVSGLLAAATMWALTEEVVRQMQAAGLTPSVLASNHLPGAAEFNARMRARFQQLGY